MDLISRQDAIDAVIKYCTKYDLRELLADIEVLPSVEQAQKTGKWIATDKGLKATIYECSECGIYVVDDTGYDVVKDYPYCHCGARMVGKEE